MRARVASGPGDGEAAVLLADALVRSARVAGDASLPLEAERASGDLSHVPADYGARRMLGVVLLAQHRLPRPRRPLKAGRRVPTTPGIRPSRVMRCSSSGVRGSVRGVRRAEPAPARPGRLRACAYARELQGDLARSARACGWRRCTGAHDPEAQARYLTQLGDDWAPREGAAG